MFVYFDTNIYNQIADGMQEAESLREALARNGIELVFGDTDLRELGQTFLNDQNRGIQLFQAVLALQPSRFLKPLGQLLREELRGTQQKQYRPQHFYTSQITTRYWRELQSLANGDFGMEARAFIRQKLAERPIAFASWMQLVESVQTQWCPQPSSETFEEFYRRAGKCLRRDEIRDVCMNQLGTPSGGNAARVSKAIDTRPSRYPHLTTFVKSTWALAFDYARPGVKRKQNDLDDMKHALNSPLVEVFCSNDEDLRRRRQMLQPNKKSISLHQLAIELGL